MLHSAGGATEALPFEHDPDPSPLGRSLAGGWNSRLRILRPAVREGYLKFGPGAGVRGKELVELAPGVTEDEVRDKTEPKLAGL
jgi:biotin/methionine sulfoxide reductase